jgi:hypothetical protein
VVNLLLVNKNALPERDGITQRVQKSFLTWMHEIVVLSKVSAVSAQVNNSNLSEGFLTVARKVNQAGQFLDNFTRQLWVKVYNDVLNKMTKTRFLSQH